MARRAVELVLSGVSLSRPCGETPSVTGEAWSARVAGEGAAVVAGMPMFAWKNSCLRCDLYSCENCKL